MLPGLWTFQIVEAYDDGYWTAFRDADRRVREQAVGGARHLLEARMKEEEQGRGTVAP